MYYYYCLGITFAKRCDRKHVQDGEQSQVIVSRWMVNPYIHIVRRALEGDRGLFSFRNSRCFVVVKLSSLLTLCCVCPWLHVCFSLWMQQWCRCVQSALRSINRPPAGIITDERNSSTIPIIHKCLSNFYSNINISPLTHWCWFNCHFRD